MELVVYIKNSKKFIDFYDYSKMLWNAGNIFYEL